MDKVWAIIPARGGSKGLYKKNIQLLAGKPLIAYSIEAALKSKRISKVVVSTEDIEIAHEAEKWGADVPILRPSLLATDRTPVVKAVDWTVDELSKIYGAPDAIITLLPSHPFRSGEMIDESINLLKSHRKVTTAVPVNINPSKLYFMHEETKYRFDSKEKMLQVFQLTGTVLSSIYVPPGYRFTENPLKFMEYVKFMKNNYPEFSLQGALQILNETDSHVDIDTLDDLLTAEKLLSGEKVTIRPRYTSLYSSVIGMDLIYPLSTVYGTTVTLPIKPKDDSTYIIQLAESPNGDDSLTGEFVYRKVEVQNGEIHSVPLFGDKKDIAVEKVGEQLKITWQSPKSTEYMKVAVGTTVDGPVCNYYSHYSFSPLWKCDISTGIKYNLLTNMQINGRQDIPEILSEENDLIVPGLAYAISKPR
ncbi:MAG: acylneuraminate cytidylyltransferase family protein [Planctomycetes bacterium]|nr:acylneuraminate cytidylyltransferase family protein [Planctomycetota bacterium]